MFQPTILFRRLRRRQVLATSIFLLLAFGPALASATIVVCWRLVRPELPVARPEDLVFLYRSQAPELPLGNGPPALLSTRDLEAIERAGVFAKLGASALVRTAARAQNKTVTVFGEVVNDDYFDAVAIDGIAGRGLGRDDASGDLSVVISSRLALELYGSDQKAIGSTLWLASEPHTVVGVVPPKWGGVRAPGNGGTKFWALFRQHRAHWFPGNAVPPFENANFGAFAAIGRLPATAIPSAASTLTKLARQLESATPSPQWPREFIVRPFTEVAIAAGADQYLHDLAIGIAASIGAITLLLAATVGILHAQLNTSFSDELATRLALGASPFGLISVPGSLALFVHGCALTVSFVVFGALLSYVSNQFGTELLALWKLPPSILVFLLGWLPYVSASILGFVPGAVRLGTQGARRWIPVRGWLAHAWLGLSVAVLIALGTIAIGLMYQSTRLPALRHESNWAGTYAFAVNFDLVSEDRGPANPAIEVEHRLKSVESVAAVGWTTSLAPGADSTAWPLAGWLLDRPFDVAQERQGRVIGLVPISFGFQQFVPLQLVTGRLLSEEDSLTASRTALLSESSATALFGNANPLHRRVWIRQATRSASPDQEWEIVGVIQDWLSNSERFWRSPPIFVPFTSVSSNGAYLTVRSAPAALGTVLASISSLPLSVSASGPILALQANRGYPALLLLNRLFLVLAATAAFVTLACAVSLIASEIASRRDELFVRTALGARQSDLLRAVSGRYAASLVGASCACMALLPQATGWVNDFALSARPDVSRERLSSTTLYVFVLLVLLLVLAVMMTAIVSRLHKLHPVSVVRGEGRSK